MIFSRPHNSSGGSGTPKPIRRPAFTLLELIVVIIIVGIVVALLLPTVRRGGEPARRSVCKNNLKQIGLALHNYHDMYGTLPPPYTTDADGKPLHSWRTLLLPFLDQQPLYERIDLSKPWDDSANEDVYATDLQVFRCPSTNLEVSHTTYLALVTADSLFREHESRVLSSLSENVRQNVMVIEVAPEYAVHWMDPLDADWETGMGFNSETQFAHTGGMHYLRGDGGVEFLSATVSDEDRQKITSVE